MLESPAHIKRRDAAVADEVSDVLIRAYLNASSEEDKNRALDVIDRAFVLNAYGAQRVLSEHDCGSN